jgi:hypothetical protein
MDFGGRSDKHRMAAVKIQRNCTKPSVSRRKARKHESVSDEQISTVQTKLDGLEESAPVVMPRIYYRVEARYRNVKYVGEALELYNK